MNKRQYLCSSYDIFYFTTFIVATRAIFIYPTNHQVLQGENITFNCLVNSAEPCVWRLQNGAIINKSLKDYHISHNVENGICNLTINNVSVARDEGHISCLIPMSDEHPTGLISNISYVNVVVPPTIPFVTYNEYKLKNNSAINIKTSKKLTTFTCKTSHGNPSSYIYWVINNESYTGNLTISDAGNKLKTTTNVFTLHLDFKFDSKNLTCIAEHLFNKSEKIIVKLNISYDTNYVTTEHNYLIVNEGDDINFICRANGNPHPQFEWRFKAAETNEWQVISNKASFREIALKTREGKYLCLAGNKEPMLWSKEMTVQIIEKPIASFASLPLLFCSFAVVTLFSIILVTGLMHRKKKQQLKRSVNNTKSDETSKNLSFGVKAQPGKSGNLYFQSKNEKKKSALSTDSYIYMITKRPLPPIEEVDNDQYIGLDPIDDNKSGISSSENPAAQSNVYEEPYVYENSRPKGISTIC